MTFVEDFVLLIAGVITLPPAKPKNYILGTLSPLSLARYDVQIVSSLANQINNQTALTDKQSQLAIKLVNKYRKQLKTLYPNLTIPEVLDQFRLGIRNLDRTRSVTIENNKFILKFPYDIEMIDEIRSLVKTANGSAEFDRTNRIWRLAMTEYMLNWIMTVAYRKNFIIDDNIKKLFEEILLVERTGYAIELLEVQNGFVIKNADTSLIEYINNELGGFGFDNFLTLMDYSSILGYTVNENLIKKLKNQYSEEIVNLILNRKSDITYSNFDIVIKYARLVNRTPIHIYDPTYSNNKDNDIINLTTSNAPNPSKIKLLITTPILIGPKKQSWLTNAEKILLLK